MFYRLGIAALVGAFTLSHGGCNDEMQGATPLVAQVIVGEPSIAGVYDSECRLCSPAPCGEASKENIFAFGSDEDYFKRQGGDDALALSYLEAGVSDSQMSALLELGILPEQYGVFNDTSRPNMLITLPYDEGTKRDDAGNAVARRHFYHNVDVLEPLLEVYDVALAFTRTEKQLCDLTNERKYDAGIIAGHGEVDLLELTVANRGVSNDERYFSVRDLEGFDSSACLDGFGEDSVIMLWSCSNGAGEDTRHNLANAVHSATGSRVFSSRTPFNVNATVIMSYDPLEVVFYDSDNPDMNSTYIVEARD